MGSQRHPIPLDDNEPAVAPDTPPELLPEKFADKRRFLCFLFFVLHAA